MTTTSPGPWVHRSYLNGVSTRKVDWLVEQLGIHGMSKDRVSALCSAGPGTPERSPHRRSAALGRMNRGDC